MENRKLEPIFAPDDDWQTNACLNFLYDPTNLYATGYKNAGDLLAKHVLGTGLDQDFYIYPLLFLYRHYIELRLKEVIRSGRIITESRGIDFPKHHDISRLWEEVKTLSREVFDDEKEPSEWQYVGHVIKEFTKLDPASMSFRYAFDKAGQNNLEGISHIGIQRIVEHVDELSKDLDAISAGMSAELDLHYEMLSSFDAYS